MAVNRNEMFPLVDPEGRVIGSASRGDCHSGSMLLHPVVHLHVVSSDGCLYLQKRSMDKDIQPGRWDTAVGGHVDMGESVGDALRREAREEIGLTGFEPVALKPYVFQSAVERELVNPYYTVIAADTCFDLDPAEVDEGRFWSVAEIEAALGRGVFTPNFESEFAAIRGFLPLAL